MTNLIIRATLLIVLLATPLVGADDLPVPPPQCPQADHSETARLAEAIYLAQAPTAEETNNFERARQEYSEQKRRRKHLDQLRVLKMLELLDLGEAQEVEFLTAFHRMQKEQRRLSEQIRQMVDSLGLQLQQETVKEARLNSSIDRLRALEEEKHRLLREFVGEARSIVDTEQLARLVIFQHRFESELLERVGRFRRGRFGQQGSPGPPQDKP